MNLLLLSTSSSRKAGGLYNSVRNLGQELYRQKKVKPMVLAYRDSFTDLDISAYAPLPIELYDIIGPAGIAYSFNLNSKIENFKPHIIHQQGIYLYSSYVNSKYSDKYSTPYIISPRGMLDKWILNNNKLKKKIGFSLYEHKNLRNASCINALGIPEYNAVREFGLKNPIAIIPNGVFIPKETSEKIPKASWNIDSRKTLLFLSRLHQKKGLENLLQAWKALGSLKADWKLVIAGESNGSEYEDSLRRLQSELGLSGDVFLIGPQFHKEKDITFRNADAFILPSFSEGMPMAVLEAWSYKLPVIITDECNLPDGFTHDCAIRIEPNVDSIYDGIIKLLNLSNSEMKQIGHNGFELVKSKYTWLSIAEEMSNVYSWMLDESLPIPSSIRLD
jgi:glycosyltransferase involved in cell wall biosynthesis